MSEGYEFTVDWFSPHIPYWSSILRQLRPAVAVEIGSFEGRSTCHLIETCGAQNPFELYCIDTWLGGVEHSAQRMLNAEDRFDHNIALAVSRAAHDVKVIKRKQRSVEALADLIAERRRADIDFIYVDGSHQAPDVLSDAVLAFQLLRVGGVMIFDDYLWFRVGSDPRQRDPLDMPKPAIDAFLNLFMRKIRIIQDGAPGQVFAQKIAE